MTQTAKRLGDGEYEYRGWNIWRNDNVPTGYWGRWVISARKGGKFETLREAKQHIDGLLDKVEEREDDMQARYNIVKIEEQFTGSRFERDYVTAHESLTGVEAERVVENLGGNAWMYLVEELYWCDIYNAWEGDESVVADEWLEDRRRKEAAASDPAERMKDLVV